MSDLLNRHLRRLTQDHVKFSPEDQVDGVRYQEGLARFGILEQR